MSAINTLYKTYVNCEENGLVDRCDELNSKTVLLPLYHKNKRANGNDIITITINEDSKCIQALFVDKDQWIVFPVTESSSSRTSSPSPHALCDDLSYLSTRINTDKHKLFMDNLLAWDQYNDEDLCFKELTIIKKYLLNEDILLDIGKYLHLDNVNIEINETENEKKDNEVTLVYNEKAKDKIVTSKLKNFSKIFIEFSIEYDDKVKKNYYVSRSNILHELHINYQEQLMKEKDRKTCAISGEDMYCTEIHRGTFGSSKLISISNNTEVYSGRFSSSKDYKGVINIGFRTSNKIFNMLKYLLDNQQSHKNLGEDAHLFTWFVEENNFQYSIDLTGFSELYDLENEVDFDAVSEYNKEINKILSGIKLGEITSNCCVMILEKTSNGRSSIKYFRELETSDLYDRVKGWYDSTSWEYYNINLKTYKDSVTPLYKYANLLYGDLDKDQIICRNYKLKKQTLERLIPCIIDNKQIPEDIVRKAFNNCCQRYRYSNNKAWTQLIRFSCGILKNNQNNKKEVKKMLDENNTNVSYLYGRLLAISEKVELDTFSEEEQKRRTTNAARLWSTFINRPATTWVVLHGKIQPYLLKPGYKGNTARNYYNLIVSDIMSKIDVNDESKNKKLSEDFIFGYYHQLKALYTKNNSAKKEEE